MAKLWTAVPKYTRGFCCKKQTRPVTLHLAHLPDNHSASSCLSITRAQVNFAVATYMQIENCTLDQRQPRESSQLTTHHCTALDFETELNPTASDYVDSASFAFLTQHSHTYTDKKTNLQENYAQNNVLKTTSKKTTSTEALEHDLDPIFSIFSHSHDGKQPQ